MKNKIINLVSKVLECKVDENSTKDNTENWDSLNHVKLILELQEKFEIKVPTEDIDKILSVKDIIDYVSKKTE